jgi:malate dehydrogenase (oxaloacetate-decarboxylating)
MNQNTKPAWPKNWSAAQIAEAENVYQQILCVLFTQQHGSAFRVVSMTTIDQPNLQTKYSPGIAGPVVAIENGELDAPIFDAGLFSDGSRPLGIGKLTKPIAALPIMIGKAEIAGTFGAVDVYPFCLDSQDDVGGFCEAVKRLAPNFRIIMIEDIESPECYLILDMLQKMLPNKPIWHDDRQGTAGAVLAALYRALEETEKKIEDIRITFLGAGASNSTTAELLIRAGVNPDNMIMCDSKGPLHSGRDDIRLDKRHFVKWGLCKSTNPNKVDSKDAALEGADVLIALSTPGPGVVTAEHIHLLTDRATVMALANPRAEIDPQVAKDAGAAIVAIGLTNEEGVPQVNNSSIFPGVLAGVLAVNARQITNSMIIAGSKGAAQVAKKEGLITVPMDHPDLAPTVAACVAMQAVEEGLSDSTMSWQEVFDFVNAKVDHNNRVFQALSDAGLTSEITGEMCTEAHRQTILKIQADETA